MVNDWSSVLDCDQENEDRDALYLKDVFRMASDHSTDPNTQVAAALVSFGWLSGIVLAGWNEVPGGLAAVGYPKTLIDKNYCTEHAERRVLYKAVENGIRTNGLQLYGTWVGCSECARAIIQFGIRRVVTFSALVEQTPPRWSESVWHGLNMMKDSGIQVVGWRGEIVTDKTIRFDGRVISGKDLV